MTNLFGDQLTDKVVLPRMLVEDWFHTTQRDFTCELVPFMSSSANLALASYMQSSQTKNWRGARAI